MSTLNPCTGGAKRHATNAASAPDRNRCHLALADRLNLLPPSLRLLLLPLPPTALVVALPMLIILLATGPGSFIVVAIFVSVATPHATPCRAVLQQSVSQSDSQLLLRFRGSCDILDSHQRRSIAATTRQRRDRSNTHENSSLLFLLLRVETISRNLCANSSSL